MRYIDKSTELLIGKAFSVHTITFGNHTAVVIWLFDLNEHQRQTVHKKRNVGTKFILPVLTSKLRCTMKDIIMRIIKIYKTNRRN